MNLDHSTNVLGMAQTQSSINLLQNQLISLSYFLCNTALVLLLRQSYVCSQLALKFHQQKQSFCRHQPLETKNPAQCPLLFVCNLEIAKERESSVVGLSVRIRLFPVRILPSSTSPSQELQELGDGGVGGSGGGSATEEEGRVRRRRPDSATGDTAKGGGRVRRRGWR
uniref:Uncharacterized protein n=1 Tax=Arundo donax TaxID=35708 RepID=A0A0A9ETZ4_ARUDO